jgi:hypothetical protein
VYLALMASVSLCPVQGNVNDTVGLATANRRMAYRYIPVYVWQRRIRAYCHSRGEAAGPDQSFHYWASISVSEVPGVTSNAFTAAG